ncbi:hypothetical protein ABR737_01325 [Streptomyces sp. Edi2]|uniref:hypothetical protein n=1 Tax=Streptomyces sp. Edi2 TaxID=3162528 RepID=UPI0033066781
MDAFIEIRRRRELEDEERRRQADRIGHHLADALNEAGVEGGGWTHQANPACYLSLDLFHSRGLQLGLRHERSHRKGNAGRMLTVSGVYPRGYCGPTASPVNVGINTSADHMARRIAQYLLPDYLKTLEVALAQQRKAREDEHARRVLNRRMEHTLPALHAASHESESAARTYSSWWAHTPLTPDSPRARASGRVRLSSDGSRAEELKLSDVPADVLLQILALLNPNPPVEGRIMPRSVAPARRELSTVRFVPGEVLSLLALTADAGAPEASRTGRLLPPGLTASTAPARGHHALNREFALPEGVPADRSSSAHDLADRDLHRRLIDE